MKEKDKVEEFLDLRTQSIVYNRKLLWECIPGQHHPSHKHLPMCDLGKSEEPLYYVTRKQRGRLGVGEGRERGRYRDDESGRQHHLIRNDPPHTSKVMWPSLCRQPIQWQREIGNSVGIDCTCRSHCIVRGEEQKGECVRQMAMNINHSNRFQDLYWEAAPIKRLILTGGQGSNMYSTVQWQSAVATYYYGLIVCLISWHNYIYSRCNCVNSQNQTNTETGE